MNNFSLFIFHFSLFIVPLHRIFEKMLCENRLHLNKKQAFCVRFALSLTPAFLKIAPIKVGFRLVR